MKNNLEPISIILRLTLGVAFVMSASVHFANSDPSYANFVEIIIGGLLLIGAFTRYSAAAAIAFGIYTIVVTPLFMQNPFLSLLQSHQILAQIGGSTALYIIGAPVLSLDKFFFPFKQQKSVNEEYLGNLLAYSLATSFALTFASIFLFIDDGNYVIFEQWKNLPTKLPFLNMPLLASFVAVASILLFFNFGRRTTAFLASIIFMFVALTDNSHSQVIVILGIAMCISLCPIESRKMKIIPRRKAEEYI